jgi:hypothetical protein
VTLPVTALLRYLALGSSSTRGAGASSVESSYVELIAQHLRSTHAVGVLNLGSGGATVEDFLASAERIATFAPEVITVLPFTDVVRTPPLRFVEGYASLFSRLGATIFFGDLRIDPVYASRYTQRDRDVVAEKNAAVEQLARACPRLTVVPVFDQNVAHPEWNAPDGHPNDLGHAYLAGAFVSLMGTLPVP